MYSTITGLLLITQYNISLTTYFSYKPVGRKFIILKFIS